MRKLLALCLFLSACSGSSEFYKDYDIGKEKQASVGSVMVTATGELKVADEETKVTGQLTYGGVANRVLRIGYREYGEDLTKPAVFQELQYDLGESNTIAFRDMTILVLEATNKQIRFKVLAGPEDPDAPVQGGATVDSPPPVFPQ